MALVVRAFPVQGREGVDSFVEEIQRRSDETREFYRSFAVRREAWFYQAADDVDLVIGVTDIEDPVGPKAAAYAAAAGEFATWFKERVLALSGVDANEEPLGPATQLVWNATCGKLSADRTIVARAYPLRSRDALLEFVRELQSRPEETRGFYERHCVEEAWWVQDTDRGSIAIAVLTTDDPERAARTYRESTDPFDVWFKQRVIEVSGVNPNRTPLGPVSEQVFEFLA